MTSTSTRAAARHALEESFFRDVDDLIVRRLHEEADSSDAKKALMKSTGLHDPMLIEELSELGVTANALVAMRLVPLVMVAWAEDSVDEEERQTVMAEALRLGMVDGSVAQALLEHWLRVKPPLTILDAWKRYTHSEFAQMSGVAKQKLTTLMEDQLIAVAKSSGGHVGIGKVSAKEQALIELLTRVLRE